MSSENNRTHSSHKKSSRRHHRNKLYDNEALKSLDSQLPSDQISIDIVDHLRNSKNDPASPVSEVIIGADGISSFANPYENKDSDN